MRRSWMKWILGAGGGLGLLGAAVPGAAAPPPAAVGGFEYPESVYWDQASTSFYVSNFGPDADPSGQEGNGYLSRLDGSGRVVAQRWVAGLRSPKGMRVHAGRLYVADVGQVVVVDVAGGAIADVIDLEAAGARFPNDVAIEPKSGDVYVSDTMRDTIWRLPGGVGPGEPWLETPQLEGPNGLLVDGGRLLVATLGPGPDPGSSANRAPGRVLAVDLATKAVQPYGGMGPTATLDGIEALGGGHLLVTDNPGGRLLRVAPDGAVTEVAVEEPGTADLGRRSTDGMVAIPMLRGDQVRFRAVPAG
jgi:DNA-binding beta-propeller fold protein YncE